MVRPKVLFVDDQKPARDLFARMLDAKRYETLLATGVTSAAEVLARERPDVVITDLRMPEIDGLVGLDRFRALSPATPVILVTAFGSVETAVQAMKRGAFDYIRKPFDPTELEMVIDRALEHHELVRENERLRSQVARRGDGSQIVWSSPAMGSVMDLIGRVAPVNTSVLLLGESGTGKDLMASWLHKCSQRADGQFVTLNCSAIPEHLLESELFGHVKGAFSGACAERTGFFAEADGGTLFLDEIGDMSRNLQPKLLRVLQNGEFYRVGSRHLSKADVRLVCASNQPIADLVKSGEFREDLFYRINTVTVRIPPLRQRTGDVPLLVEHFLTQLSDRSPRIPGSVSKGAMRRLLDYSWPGNVRELQNAIERASVVCDSDEIRVRDLPTEVQAPARTEGSQAFAGYREARREFERDYFTRLLEGAGGKVPAAAEVAGIHRSTLYEKLGRLDIHFERD